jgi:tetratricopeptide (TPR) repeat protein
MRKFIIFIFIFIFLTLICSCSEKSKNASYWIEKGKKLWNGKQYTDPEKAIKYLNKAIELQQNNAETYNNRGTAYYNLGQYKMAIEDFNRAINLKQDNAEACNNRGAAYKKLDQYQLAIESFNKAISLKQDFVDAYNNRGVVYLIHGNKERGCRDIKKSCELGDCRTLEQAKNKGLCR